MASSLRQRALEKIAALSADSSSKQYEQHDLDRLCSAGPGYRTGNGVYSEASNGLMTAGAGEIPLSIREYEVLLSLCRAAPALQSLQSAQKLARHLLSYLMDSHVRVFAPSPFFRRVEPSPSESLSFHVTAALLSLGIRHPEVQQTVSDKIWAFLNACIQAAESISQVDVDVDGDGDGDGDDDGDINGYGNGNVDGNGNFDGNDNGDGDGDSDSDSDSDGDGDGDGQISTTTILDLDDAVRTATISLALLGFLDAASAQADFWRSGGRLGLLLRLRGLLSQPFLLAVEAAISTLRNAYSHDRHIKEWKRCLRHYEDVGRPLGALLLQRSFMWLLVANTSLLLVADANALRSGANVLDILMTGRGLKQPLETDSSDEVVVVDFPSVETYANVAIDQMNHLESSADFDSLSPAKQKLASAVKGAALISYLNACTLNGEAADALVLVSWLEDTLADPTSMADEGLATVVLKCLALVCRVVAPYAVTASRLLPQYVVQSTTGSNLVMQTASRCLAYVLQMLSTDAVITTLYTLGNVLSPGGQQWQKTSAGGGGTSGTSGTSGDATVLQAGRASHHGSSASLRAGAGAGEGDEASAVVQSNVVQAICDISARSRNDKMTSLAQSMLAQKMVKVGNTALDARIVTGAAALALGGGVAEFRNLLKRLAGLVHDAVAAGERGEGEEGVLGAVRQARNYLSAHVTRGSALYDIYLEHLLDGIITKGDARSSKDSLHDTDVETAAREMAELLQPLAVFLSAHDVASDATSNDDAHTLLRDGWFNLVVHGYFPTTERGLRYARELRIMAFHSPPLVLESRGEQDESDIELNPILRRGESSESESQHKRQLTEVLPSGRGAEVRGLSYRKVMFLQAAFLVESLRAEAGDCTKAASCFLEPSMRRGDVSRTMDAILGVVMDKYLAKTLGAATPMFSAAFAARQLATIFCDCCHRIERVQQAAYGCADRIICDVPSALCQRSSIFALLELLSLMWSANLEAETDRYESRTRFRSARGRVTVELSDDYRFRHLTLQNLHAKARAWLTNAVDVAPADVKGLLQTYLSEYDDEGQYGHPSLGRSLALEIGSAIPATDQRLSSLDPFGDCPVNMASDFVAQYTARQEYRYSETPLLDQSIEWSAFMRRNRHRAGSSGSSRGPDSDPREAQQDSADLVTVLARTERRTATRSAPLPSLADVRDLLRRAAALLCRSPHDECSVAHHLVSIPFALFTKPSIELGVSLWLGVINEAPAKGPRLMAEIGQQWELSIQRRLGLFSPALVSPDPFCLRKEFAPSDHAALARRRAAVHSLLAPHTRLLQFFSSHYNATRLGNPDTERMFLRLLHVTLDAVKALSPPHPMARELRFQLVLFGLRVLRTSTAVAATAQWRLKDSILTAALSWFAAPPRWSFGSNVLQLKTEMRLLSDVIALLRATSHVGAQAAGHVRSFVAKERLLLLLLESELLRLTVWVHPMGDPAKSQQAALHANRAALETALLPLVPTAWAENPSLAVQLAIRFPFARLVKEVRAFILNRPDRAVSDPDALPLLLGPSLPDDLTFQLKYLLFWAPVNPVTAVTYFLPAYRNHPYLIQYAMRALESHSVDVTFFYVPQIVQTLRYDALGYVARYIVDTAQFSQRFAHQIIWNMKANSYKDDDSTVPDAIKPTLDHVMNQMTDNFSDLDRAFYEREFRFFDEVTSISGKLKPLTKKSKPEKKQKIEEELRKIAVEVGVYLPSNPDGVVIGIDRTSGKPLQSHAKAPFMATFRIKKTLAISTHEKGLQASDDMIAEAVKDSTAGPEPPQQDLAKQSTPDLSVETWQSAIFKVGDDCRQDVLALQMIAAFRGIFHSVGLDVYVFPYRVTATAPGCGVIDVLPNSISRDMLGREAVNGLYDYFISKYGNEDSLRFQQARNNFVKSMAAYSVISFLLQFKDRHNGNIMIDDAGHILHIDFGFCFDIAPGGIKFERAPFKLTSEMVAVMGGHSNHQAFKWFEELCVKSYLAARPHADKLAQIVLLMMESGLPCFKPESVKHFKERFVLGQSEREAADFMRDLIKKSNASYSTGIYDQFQLLTNGIPY